MKKRDMVGQAVAIAAALAIGVGVATTAGAQTPAQLGVEIGVGTAAQASAPAAPRRIGDSASLSSGVPITAPNTVDAGQQVNVVVDGAQPGARIELWGPVTQAGRGGQLAASPLTGGVAPLTAPDMSGSYELRYLDAQGRTQGRQAFDVAAVPVALTVPTPIGAGGVLEVTWQGPARPGDRFEIVSEAGVVAGSTPVAGDRAGVNRTPVEAPAQSGRYELRYVTGQGAVLRSVGFQIR